MDDLDRVPTNGETAPTDPKLTSSRYAAVFVIEGEIEWEIASWLEVLGRRRIERGAGALAIDCTDIPGPSGHLLGALLRLARLAADGEATLGVAACGTTAEVIHGHVPNLTIAPALTDLLEAIGAVSEAQPLKLVGRPARPAADRDRG